MDQVSRHSFIMTGFGPRHTSTGASSIELAPATLLGLTRVPNFSSITMCRLQFLCHAPALLPSALPGFFLNITPFQYFCQHISSLSRTTRFKHVLSIGSPVPSCSSPFLQVLHFTSAVCSSTNNRTSHCLRCPHHWFELAYLHLRLISLTWQHITFVSGTSMVFTFDTTSWQLNFVFIDTALCDHQIKIVRFTLPHDDHFILHYYVPSQFITVIPSGSVWISKKQSPRGLPKQKQTRRSRALTYNLNSEKQSPRGLPKQKQTRRFCALTLTYKITKSILHFSAIGTLGSLIVFPRSVTALNSKAASQLPRAPNVTSLHPFNICVPDDNEGSPQLSTSDVYKSLSLHLSSTRLFLRTLICAKPPLLHKTFDIVSLTFPEAPANIDCLVYYGIANFVLMSRVTQVFVFHLLGWLVSSFSNCSPDSTFLGLLTLFPCLAPRLSTQHVFAPCLGLIFVTTSPFGFIFVLNKFFDFTHSSSTDLLSSALFITSMSRVCLDFPVFRPLTSVARAQLGFGFSVASLTSASARSPSVSLQPASASLTSVLGSLRLTRQQSQCHMQRARQQLCQIYCMRKRQLSALCSSVTSTSVLQCEQSQRWIRPCTTQCRNTRPTAQPVPAPRTISTHTGKHVLHNETCTYYRLCHPEQLISVRNNSANNYYTRGYAIDGGTAISVTKTHAAMQSRACIGSSPSPASAPETARIAIKTQNPSVFLVTAA